MKQQTRAGRKILSLPVRGETKRLTVIADSFFFSSSRNSRDAIDILRRVDLLRIISTTVSSTAAFDRAFCSSCMRSADIRSDGS